MTGVLIVIGIGVAVWLIVQARERATLNRAERDSFKAEHAGWDIFFAPFDGAVVAFNHDGRTVVLGTARVHKTYPFSAISAVELVRDGASITSANRGSQVMGAAVGELLLGPVGLLIGGVTGSKKTVQRVKQIGLKIIVDDRATPIYTLDFLRIPGNGANPDNNLVKSAAKRAEHVHALLVNAVRNATARIITISDETATRSTADRLDQLWKLKEVGALTADEFQEQKTRLLLSLNSIVPGAR